MALSEAQLIRSGDKPRWQLRCKYSSLRCILVFTAIMALFYATIHNRSSDGVFFSPYVKLVASWTGTLLRLSGRADVEVLDQIVTSSSFSFRIGRGCEGIEPTAVFVSAVLASPSSYLTRSIGILTGILSLAILNLIRLVGLFYVGLYFPEMFDLVHEELGQTAFVLAAVVLWMLWALWARQQLST